MNSFISALTRRRKSGRPSAFWALLASVLVAASLSPTLSSAQINVKGPTASVVSTEQVRAELLAHAPDGADPGKTVWVGLQLTHQPEWHTYWKNSGDSGLPTSLQWTLPAGVTAGDIAWPLPKKIPIGNLANYGFDGTVLLPVPLTITPAFKPPLLGSELEVKLKASWLVCRKECIPGEGEFLLKIPVKGSTALNAPAFDAALKAQPQALAANLGSGVSIVGKDLKLTVSGLPAAWQGKTLDFFPETPEVIETAAQWTQSWSGGTWSASIPLSPQRLNSPSPVPVVLAWGGAAVRAELPVTGGVWPTVGSGAAQVTTPSAAPALVNNPGAPASLWLALAGALLGGLILNLMPCVFPVLAIKLVNFAQHASDHRRHRISGLAYSLGVVLSFVALGTLMLALRAAGESLGWGFQLQSPWVVAALAGLFTLLGLNLAGMFEFGQMLPTSVASLQAKHPVLDAVLTGVLAVAIASPCTAPFMGASLGLAVSLPALQALLVFAALGVGMALPYLAASFVPAVARSLPRPGAWMQTFRQLMAFPMFATVVWLVWVLGQQTGIDGAGALLALLVAFSALVWSFTLKGRSRVALSLALLLTFSALGLSLGPNVGRMAAPQATGAAGERWQPWAPGRVEQVLAGGQPVFVDFTAAWCVTCQYNKKTTLADAALLADLDARTVQLLRADWTRRDPAITEALGALGRNGVPVYVLYQNGHAPVVLSEVLSVSEVRAALATL
jgi:thiol:disulfide interchange protein DsbD